MSTLENDDAIVPFERLLGFHDAPQAIQCRHCKAIKLANLRNFRNTRGKLDRFRTVCKPCESKQAYARSSYGQIRAIDNDPSLPEPLKRFFREEALAKAKERGREARQAHYAKLRDDKFTQQWALVRALVTERRTLLYKQVTHNAGTGHWGRRLSIGRQMYRPEDRDPPDPKGSGFLRHYIQAYLDVFSAVIARLHHLQAWEERIGGKHLPPPELRRPAEALFRYVLPDPTVPHAKPRIEARDDVSTAGVRGQPSPWVETVLSFEPLWLATREERDRLWELNPRRFTGPGHSAHVPGAWISDYEYKLWWDAAAGDRDGRLSVLMQILGGRSHDSSTCPAWLRAFNGIRDNVSRKE